MKAHRLLALLLAAGIIGTGCTRAFFPGPDSGSQIGMTTIDYEVKAGNWIERDGMFEAELSVPDITRNILNSANVQVLRRYPGDGFADDTWTPLPAMRTEVIQTPDGGDYYYTTFIDYEWTVGAVYIYVTTSDLYTGNKPSDMSFRVIITG